MEFGINHANYAQHLNQLIKIIGISQEKEGLNMKDVEAAILLGLSLRKEHEKLEKELLKHSGEHPTVVCNGEWKNVTHWMYLPKPLEEQFGKTVRFQRFESLST